MSVRIQGEVLDGAASSQVSRANEAEHTGRNAGARRTPGAAAGTDSIALSSLAKRVSEANDEAAARSTARVSELAAQYATGAYKVDSIKLSHTLVSKAIDATAGEQ